MMDWPVFYTYRDEDLEGFNVGSFCIVELSNSVSPGILRGKQIKDWCLSQTDDDCRRRNGSRLDPDRLVYDVYKKPYSAVNGKPSSSIIVIIIIIIIVRPKRVMGGLKLSWKLLLIFFLRFK